MSTSLRTPKTAAASSRDTVPPTTDRRSRRRLRELCDEVLASWRAAHDRELFSEEDRRTGRELVGRLGGR